MANGDEIVPPRHLHMTYSKCAFPLVGALYDYVDTSFEYFSSKTINADRLQCKSSKTTLSSSFMAVVCLVLGFVCNIKLEAVTKVPLPDDLHFMLMSKRDNFYINDVDVSKVIWCIESSDCVGLVISCALILYSSNVPSPLSEYLFLPWLGVALRGALLRQAPTVGALLYTTAVAAGQFSPLFFTAFILLFLLEGRLWLEVVGLLCSRWRRRHHTALAAAPYEVETLWTNGDDQSVEVRNYIY